MLGRRGSREVQVGSEKAGKQRSMGSERAGGQEGVGVRKEGGTVVITCSEFFFLFFFSPM